ncbi:hypothetical protein FHT72_006520 [Rhizobium sp. BK077]|nr:hypothetical protein [Rhizobium sp. BK112]MBB3371988.1 hypothetical protein [Rhizobium sp. BK077]MBB4182954.1 hypothetical protein [Rhizobium sp. BK109]
MLVIPNSDAGRITRRYSPANRCIYCGTTSGPLGDEHIIPFAIAGDAAILPEASCQPCADINNKIEGPMHRRQLKELRSVINSPTRRPRDRPKRLSIGLSHFATFKSGEQARYLGESEVDVKSFPVSYASLYLDKPGILLGLPLGTPLPWNVRHHGSFTETSDPFRDGANAARIGSINPYLTAQYLARIAFAYAVAEEGAGSFMPLVLDLITARTSYFRHWVGGDLAIPAADPASLHLISRRWVKSKGIAYLVVTLRLFCFLGTPINHVVVGRENGPLSV